MGMRSLSVPVQAEKPASPRPSDSILEVGKKAAKAIKKTAKFAENNENNTNVMSAPVVPPISMKNMAEMRSKRITLAVSSPKKESKPKLIRSKSLSYGFKNSWDYSSNFVDPEEAYEDEALRILQESIELREAEKKDFEKIKNTIIAQATEEDSPRSTPDLKKENGHILGVSKERMVNLITSPLNTIAPEVFHRFLLTYRLWFLPEELLRMICERYKSTSRGRSGSMITFNSDEEARVALWVKVLDVIKIWIARNPHDFMTSSARTQLEIFTSEAITSVNNLDSDTNKRSLLQLIDLLMSSVAKLGAGASIRRWSVRAKQSGYMRPLQPVKNEKLTSVLEIAPVEFARQLSVHWKKLLDRIHPADFILLKNNNVGRGALMSLTDEFNTLTNWVTHEIVTTANIKKRVKLIEHFLLIIKKLLELNNFLGATGIFFGTQMMACQRLRQTWKEINKKHKEFIASLTSLFAPLGNFAMLRKAITKRSNLVGSATIPFLPIIQKDVVALHEVYKDTIEDDLINMKKIETLGTCLLPFWECQQVSYKIIEVPQIQEFIMKIGPIVEDRKLMQYSKQCEPPVLEHSKEYKTRTKEKKKEVKKRKRAKAAEDPIKAIFGSIIS